MTAPFITATVFNCANGCFAWEHARQLIPWHIAGSPKLKDGQRVRLRPVGFGNEAELVRRLPAIKAEGIK